MAGSFHFCVFQFLLYSVLMQPTYRQTRLPSFFNIQSHWTAVLGTMHADFFRSRMIIRLSLNSLVWFSFGNQFHNPSFSGPQPLFWFSPIKTKCVSQTPLKVLLFSSCGFYCSLLRVSCTSRFLLSLYDFFSRIVAWIGTRTDGESSFSSPYISLFCTATF